MMGCERAYLTTSSSEGVEYSLYDNVRVFDENFAEPHIGQIAQLWEDKVSDTRKVLIRWFLRHKEVKPHVDDNPKELFLAFGEGKGVANENDLDVIVGKCKVVCTSKDPQNNQPSASDIENSDYFFSHVYDVDLEHTSPVEGVIDKLGLDAILNKQECMTASSKIEEKANELQGNCLLKDDVKEPLAVGNILSEVRKRPRDVEKVSNLQRKKLGQQADLKKGQLSSDESLRRNKIKASEGNALLSDETQEKVGGNLVSKLSMAMPGQGSNTGDVIIKKIQMTNVENPHGGSSVSPRKAEKGEITSLEYCDVPESIKNSSIQEILPLPRTTVEQYAIEESPQNGSNLRQANDEVKLAEKAQKKSNAFSKGTQKLENMDGLNLAETDLGLMGDEQCRRQFSKAKERVRPDNTLDLEKVEAERGQKVDLTKEGRSNIVKKMKMVTCVETEKRPMSTVEMVRATEKRKIFKELPWEESLEQGLPNGKVLLLQNFDPWATSADVRDMLKNTFQGLLDARVLPQESICPSGQALAIFETKVLADYALEAMEMKCLVVTDSKRPVIATRVKESASQFRFPGHLALEKLKLGRSLSTEEYRRAVSTSHCSQPNTIEFEMAMEWRQLQEITQNCRVELFKKQRKEINDLKSRGTSKAQKSKQEKP